MNKIRGGLVQWVPVEERLPEQNIATLLWRACFDDEDFPEYGWFCECGCERFVELVNDPAMKLEDVTHWLEWGIPVVSGSGL